jgi:hypothetical protein
MTHRPLLDGSRAKALFGDLGDVAMRIVNSIGESLVQIVNNDESAAVAAISAALKDSMRLERILRLLEAGEVERAEALLLEFKTKRD